MVEQDEGHAADDPSSVEDPRGADCESDNAAWRQGAFAQAKAAKLAPVKFIRGGNRDRRNVAGFSLRRILCPNSAACLPSAWKLTTAPDDSEANKAIRETVDWR